MDHIVCICIEVAHDVLIRVVQSKVYISSRHLFWKLNLQRLLMLCLRSRLGFLGLLYAW